MAYKYKRRKGKKHTTAKKQVEDGIEFASGLEAYCYRQLKKFGIGAAYEGETFELFEAIDYPGEIYDHGKLKGKKVFKQKSGRIRSISYTPDFISRHEGFVIETKGMRTPEFRMRFKLFFNHLKESNQPFDVYVPSNQKEVDATIGIILSKRR